MSRGEGDKPSTELACRVASEAEEKGRRIIEQNPLSEQNGSKSKQFRQGSEDKGHSYVMGRWLEDREDRPLLDRRWLKDVEIEGKDRQEGDQAPAEQTTLYERGT